MTATAMPSFDPADLLSLNGQPAPLPPGATLAELLARCDVNPQAVATAVNGQFVPRAARDSHVLHAGDQVTTFSAIVGG
ncbi:MAG: hypothetical protein RJA44_1777 [Pseudomonadota bacterium]